MTLIWHLVKKDVRRLRGAVAVLSLLTMGKLVFYACVGGVFSAPNVEWLNRLANGPELWLRLLTEPLITYLLVGWLVFEDSPVEKDAAWITRPISGWQLLATKLIAASLLFVVLPLALNGAWWCAAGLDGHEIARLGGELTAISFLLVMIGVAGASLTDGFPRFVLWSLVGLGGVGVAIQGAVALNFSGGSNLGPSRLVGCGIGIGVLSLTVSAHQFVTRRHPRSLTLLVSGIVVVAVLSAAWRWSFIQVGPPRLAPESERSADIRLAIAPPARYERIGAQPVVQLDLQMTGLPGDATAMRIRSSLDWAINGATVWKTSAAIGSSALFQDEVHRLVSAQTSPASGRAKLSTSFPPTIAQRAAREPLSLRAKINLELFHGKIVAEWPIRANASLHVVRSYTLSHFYFGPLKPRPSAKAVVAGNVSADNAVVVVRTERSLQGWTASARPAFFSQVILVNRHTGEFFLSDPVRSGPIGNATLNQVNVACWQLTFPTGPTLPPLEDLALAIIRFGDGELVTRTLEIDPMPVVTGPLEAAE